MQASRQSEDPAHHAIIFQGMISNPIPKNWYFLKLLQRKNNNMIPMFMG